MILIIMKRNDNINENNENNEIEEIICVNV